MVTGTQDAGAAGEPAESVGSEPSDRPTIVDKRSGRGKADFTDEKTYEKNQNRLSNVRWPLGQEPDAEGNNPDDGWLNVNLDVVEHPDPPINQRHLLGGGPELRLKCDKCREPLHIAASKDPVAVLNEGGIEFRGEKHPDRNVIAAVCSNGHITQLWEDFARRLVVSE